MGEMFCAFIFCVFLLLNSETGTKGYFLLNKCSALSLIFTRKCLTAFIRNFHNKVMKLQFFSFEYISSIP